MLFAGLSKRLDLVLCRLFHVSNPSEASADEQVECGDVPEKKESSENVDVRTELKAVDVDIL